MNERKDIPSATGSVVSGAVKGAAVGGAGGAALGAGKAAASAVLRSKKGRKGVLMLLASAALPAVLVLSVILSSMAAMSSVAGRFGALGRESQAVVVAAGYSSSDISNIMAAAQGKGLPWQVLASVATMQKNAIGGEGPLHALPEAPAVAKGELGPQTYDWLAGAVLESARGVPGLQVTADIGSEADRTERGEIVLSDRYPKVTRDPWSAALEGLPLSGASTMWANGVIDQAVYWRMGAPGPSATGCISFGAAPVVGADAPVQLDAEQLGNAQRIAGAVNASGLSGKALVITYMTALQESSLRNLDYGDRDSVGLYQQRPSQGWGTVEQIMDVTLSTNAFLGIASHTSNPGLTDVDGWESMSNSGAAQAVQRSAFPDAYASWESAATWLATQYGDVPPSDGSCSFIAGGGPLGECPLTLGAIEAHLQPATINMVRCLKSHFPELFDPIGGWRPCDSIAADHPSGLAIDAMVPSYTDPARAAAVTKAAEWIMVNSKALNVRYLIWRQRVWNAEWEQQKPFSQWRVMADRGSDTQNHFDHIHSTVYGPEISGWQC